MANLEVYRCYLLLSFAITLNLQLLQCGAVSVDDFFSFGTRSDTNISNLDEAIGNIDIPNGVRYPFYGRDSPTRIVVSLAEYWHVWLSCFRSLLTEYFFA